MTKIVSFDDGLNGSPGFLFAFIASLLLHGLLIIVCVVRPLSAPKLQRPLNYMSVSMVSLPVGSKGSPGSSSAKSSMEKAPEKSKPVDTASSPASKNAISIPQQERTGSSKEIPSPNAVSLQPKVSMKKKTYQSDKLMKNAIEKMEQKVNEGKGKDRKIESALEKIKKSVEEREASGETFHFSQGAGESMGVGDGKGSGDGTGSGPGGMYGQRALDTLELYHMEIADRVKRNWIYMGQISSESTGDLVAAVVFKVMPDGEIRDFFYTSRSGNQHLDESAYKAVMKANPVGPHPPGIMQPSVTVGLRFTPEGLQ